MTKKYKEPIQYTWIWVVIIIISLIGVPWYLPQGTIYPIIIGLPYWAFISLVASIALGIFLNYVVKNCWDMEALKEDKDEGGSDI